MFHKRSVARLLVSVFLVVFLLSACATETTTSADAPVLLDAAIGSVRAVSEEDQYVKVKLAFDQDIAIHAEKADSLRITVAGNRAKDVSLEPGDTDSEAVLIIPTEAVTNGIVHVERSETANAITAITDASGKTAVSDFTISGTTPSGVSLSSVSAEPGKSIKKVDSAWNIRSIAWVGLFENGQQVQPQETRDGEVLDGFVAVHGHEFLMEREADIAEKIVETMEKNYDPSYHFDCEGEQITVEKHDSDAALDICLYQYIEVNGQRADLTAILTDVKAEEPSAEEAHEHEHEEGAKIKLSEKDRTPSGEEEELLSMLATAKLSGEPEGGTALYQTLTITGSAMPETQIYSLFDLEELLRLSYTNTSLFEESLPVYEAGYFGLDLKKFLSLCGLDAAAADLNFNLIASSGESQIVSAEELFQEDTKTILAVAGPEESAEDNSISILNIGANDIENRYPVETIIAGQEPSPEDPGYGYHNREPYLDSKELTFRVDVFQQGAEYLGAIKSFSLTTEEIEAYMQEHPACVRGGYYGTIGNEEEYPYVGVGGWLDYFQGIDLYWLLTEKMELTDFSGYAKLYDRDGECFSEISDLAYFDTEKQNAEDYYIMTSRGLKITGAVPMIGVIKNGAPILKDHTHEGPGYLAYNTLNQNLEKLGVSTEVGVVKNHNGPFIACFGNLDDYYGGAEEETGNNCIVLELYIS